MMDELWIINNFGQYQQADKTTETYFHDGLDVVVPNRTKMFSIWC